MTTFKDTSSTPKLVPPLRPNTGGRTAAADAVAGFVTKLQSNAITTCLSKISKCYDLLLPKACCMVPPGAALAFEPDKPSDEDATTLIPPSS